MRQNTWSRLRQALPFTVRGTIFLMLGLFLVLMPARIENDMVASVVGYSLIVLVLLFAGATLVQARSIQRGLQIQFTADSFSPNADTPTAELLTRIVLRMNPFSVLPLTTVSVELSFKAALPTARHVLVGASPEERILFEDIRFPHRGIWQLRSYLFSTSDLAGLSRVSWTEEDAAQHALVHVLPALHPERSLPVLTSAVRSGDAVSDILERQGDLFDLKQYQPSDGMRRVLWKVFAKRGELISRHPERAVSPEGQVVCFVIAAEYDDKVCAEALHFARMSEDLDLELWCGCEGQRSRPIARSSSALRELLVQSVWDASAAFRDEKNQTTPATPIPSLTVALASFLGSIRASVQDSRIDKVVVFISEVRLSSSHQSRLVIEALDALSRDGTEPMLVVTKSQITSVDAESEGARNRPALTHTNGLRGSALIRSLFLQGVTREARPDLAAYNAFLGLCAQRGWEVII